MRCTGFAFIFVSIHCKPVQSTPIISDACVLFKRDFEHLRKPISREAAELVGRDWLLGRKGFVDTYKASCPVTITASVRKPQLKRPNFSRNKTQ